MGKMDKLNDVYISVSNGDPLTVGVIIAVLIVLLTIVVFGIRSGSSKRRGVVFVGLCDAGKTLIFTRLLYNRYGATQTSIKENSGTYILKNKSTLRLIDLPGHERLRTQFLDSYKGFARAVVFVIDSITFPKDVKDVAEFLYILLTDPVLLTNKPKVLVVCNKSDATLAKGAKVIQAQLEKEINLLRVTQSGALESTTGSGTKQVFLGKKGKDFSFEDLRTKIDFVECSARGGKDCEQADLGKLETWMTTLV